MRKDDNGKHLNTAHVQAKINPNTSEEQSLVRDLLVNFDDAGYNDKQKIMLLVRAIFDNDVRSEVASIMNSGKQSDNHHPDRQSKFVSRSYITQKLANVSEAMEEMFKHYIGKLENQIANIEIVAMQSEADQEAYIQQELDETEQRLREQLKAKRGGSVRDRRRQGDE